MRKNVFNFCCCPRSELLFEHIAERFEKMFYLSMRSNERTLFVLHFVLITKLIKVFDIIFESAVLHTFFLKKRQKKEISTISWGMYLIIPKLTMKKKSSPPVFKFKEKVCGERFTGNWNVSTFRSFPIFGLTKLGELLLSLRTKTKNLTEQTVTEKRVFVCCDESKLKAQLGIFGLSNF